MAIDVTDEAFVIRDALNGMGWDYLGGGPYPVAPKMEFRHRDDHARITVTIESKEGEK